MTTEVTVPMDDSELFAAATAPDETPEEALVEQQEAPAEQEQPQERARDERGRFIAKQEEAPVEQEAPQEQPPPKEDDGQVPSWRLRELREARDTEARRASQYEQELGATRYQLQQMQRELHALRNPEKQPDPILETEAFLQQGVKKAIDPLQQELSELREFYSRRDAEREHGAETVNAARAAMEAGMKTGDPDAWAIYQRAMASRDPYGVFTTWHKQRAVLSQIGNDPNAWFEKQFEERLSKDQAFQSKVLERLRGSAPSGDSEGRPNIRLPQSLNKVTGAKTHIAEPSAGDTSDAGLFRYAVGNRR